MKKTIENVNLGVKYSGAFIRDGKVVKTLRQHYKRDLKVAKLLTSLSIDELITLTHEVVNYNKKLIV
jgi:hypothetical protein